MQLSVCLKNEGVIALTVSFSGYLASKADSCRLANGKLIVFVAEQ